MGDNTNFYLRQEEPNKSCFLAMRTIVLILDTEVEETLKYGSPCFVYRGRAFCYLWKDKKTNEPYFPLVEWKRLDYPMLESGDRKWMKILRVNPSQDLPIETINSVLNEALNLYKNGTIKTKWGLLNRVLNIVTLNLFQGLNSSVDRCWNEFSMTRVGALDRKGYS